MKLYQDDFNLDSDHRQRAKVVAESITDFVNTMGSNREEQEFFAFYLTRCSHRTLQQSAMGLIWQCIESLAATPDNQTDPRNRATVEFCRDIIKSVPPPRLPFI